MENPKRVLCPENEGLVSYMRQKRQELAEIPKGISEKLDMTLSKAYNSICTAKNPIKTLKDLSQIKGVGKWILKLMQGFFDSASGSSETGDTNNSKSANGTKRYVPQRNSVAYALLITLYRGTANGIEFMCKQELIDAAEASGLSRAPIAPEKGKGKLSQFGSSPRDWYSGWSCMKTLIAKGLVVKSSCPAKYMLTTEGQEIARECLVRSHLVDPRESLTIVRDSSAQNTSNLESLQPDSATEVTFSLVDLSRQKKSIDFPPESLERFMLMGYSKEQVLGAVAEVSESSQNKRISSLWPAVLCRLKEDQVYGMNLQPQTLRGSFSGISATKTLTKGQVCANANENVRMDWTCDGRNVPNFSSVCSAPFSSTLRACSSSDYPVKKSTSGISEAKTNVLSMPPLSFGESFQDVYEVVLILDDREQFASQGSRGRNLVENICKEHRIKVEVRRLPVGDGIWIARHKYVGSEYVLDFIVERKKIDDLRTSIRDNRYKDQKLRLLRCGLKKLIYLVEGDPDSSEAAESIKTACFTTEILEGFNVQRTSSLPDTLKKYGYLTRSITQLYESQLLQDQCKGTGICPSLCDFIKRCEDLEKMTVSDVFAIQLMQVPQVTEATAIAVLDLYPTLLSLAHAYSLISFESKEKPDLVAAEHRDCGHNCPGLVV